MKEILMIFVRFFAGFLGTLLAIVSVIALFVLLVVRVLPMLSLGVNQVPLSSLNEPCVLVLNLSDGVVENPNSRNPISFAIDDSSSNPLVVGQFEVLMAEAAKSEFVTGLEIIGSFSDAFAEPSLVQVSRMRKALADFAKSGKKIAAYLESGVSLPDYYLASVANSVYIGNNADFNFCGLSRTVPFFGDAFKKYGVATTLIKTGGFKNAGEVYRASKFSREEKAYLESVLLEKWNFILKDISQSRKITVEKLREISADEAVFSPQRAVELKLADGVVTYAEFLEKTSIECSKDVGDLPSLNVAELLPENRVFSDVDSVKKIALVYMSGDIVSTAVGDGISSVKYAPIFAELRENPDVAGIVVIIDSGGGDAVESDIIRQEIAKCAESVPVVFVFGETAASGAYWIATSASKILANDLTLTGSIGVFSLSFDIQKLAADYGVTFDVLKTSDSADMETIFRALTPSEVAKQEKLVSRTYSRFVQLVSSSRKMDLSATKKLADGRVFTGRTALKLGLVDGIGGELDAIKLVAELANVKAYKVEDFPSSPTLSESVREFLRKGSCFSPSDILPVKLSNSTKSILDSKSRYRSGAVYARIPFDLLR